jgi:nitrogen fixation/metabolism regulation signal transduction histidine kinase
MPAGGKLTIQTASTDIDETTAEGTELTPGQYVAVQVSDTGTGIPKDVMNRVFEPFFTTKPQGEGTGLGLATVYGIINRARGERANLLRTRPGHHRDRAAARHRAGRPRRHPAAHRTPAWPRRDGPGRR